MLNESPVDTVEQIDQEAKSPMDDATPEPLAIDEAIDDLAPISDDDEIELEVADNQSFQKVAELSIEEKSEKLKEFWNDCWNIH